MSMNKEDLAAKSLIWWKISSFAHILGSCLRKVLDLRILRIVTFVCGFLRWQLQVLGYSNVSLRHFQIPCIQHSKLFIATVNDLIRGSRPPKGWPAILNRLYPWFLRLRCPPRHSTNCPTIMVLLPYTVYQKCSGMHMISAKTKQGNKSTWIY